MPLKSLMNTGRKNLKRIGLTFTTITYHIRSNKDTENSIISPVHQLSLRSPVPSRLSDAIIFSSRPQLSPYDYIAGTITTTNIPKLSNSVTLKLRPYH